VREPTKMNISAPARMQAALPMKNVATLKPYRVGRATRRCWDERQADCCSRDNKKGRQHERRDQAAIRDRGLTANTSSLSDRDVRLETFGSDSTILHLEIASPWLTTGGTNMRWRLATAGPLDNDTAMV
jgi:hypothetical protein